MTRTHDHSLHGGGVTVFLCFMNIASHAGEGKRVAKRTLLSWSRWRAAAELRAEHLVAALGEAGLGIGMIRRTGRWSRGQTRRFVQTSAAPRFSRRRRSGASSRDLPTPAPVPCVIGSAAACNRRWRKCAGELGSRGRWRAGRSGGC